MGIIGKAWDNFSNLSYPQRITYLHLLRIHVENKSQKLNLDELQMAVGSISRSEVWRAVKDLYELGLASTFKEKQLLKPGMPATLVRLKKPRGVASIPELKVFGLLSNIEQFSNSFRRAPRKFEKRNLRLMNDAALILFYLDVNVEQRDSFFTVNDLRIWKWSKLTKARYFDAKKFLLQHEFKDIVSLIVLRGLEANHTELAFLGLNKSPAMKSSRFNLIYDAQNFDWGKIPIQLLKSSYSKEEASKFHSAILSVSIINKSEGYKNAAKSDISNHLLEKNWDSLYEYLFTKASYIHLQMHIGKKSILHKSSVELLVKVIESVFGPASVEMEAAKAFKYLYPKANSRLLAADRVEKKQKLERGLSWEVKLYVLVYYQCIQSFHQFENAVGDQLNAVGSVGFEYIKKLNVVYLDFYPKQ